MHIEDVRWCESSGPDKHVGEYGEVRVTGTVRGRNLNPDRLVQVGDWGDFQIDRITAAALNNSHKEKYSMDVDSSREETLNEPTAEQDDLAELAPEEIAMGGFDDQTISAAPSERKGVLLDDHHYFEEDEEDKPEIPKRLPRGTSSYQSAWYIEDVSDSGSDLEDVDDVGGGVSIDGSAHAADGWQDPMNNEQPMTEAGPSEYPQSETFPDPSPDEEMEQLQEYRARRRNDAEDDMEYPDEVELPPNVLARERLSRYRGLKSLRTSHWETEEDKIYEPEEWPRLLDVGNYKAAKNRFIKEALVGGVKAGTRVHIYLRNVPFRLQRPGLSSPPVALFSLLRHEHKHTAVNHSITLNSGFPTQLKSKEELILQCGPRRLVINPLFSQGGEPPNDVHKFERFLHPGRSAIASFIGPLTWGAVPSLFFKRMTSPSLAEDSTDDGVPLLIDPPAPSDDLALVATGTSLAPSSTRIIAKRIILTGHPYKIHKKLVTVRYMFFNPEDVQWFKALQLWTKRGRVGHIKESLGTHGYFKAMFDARINPMDAVGISLYKRVWPRRAKVWRPWNEDTDLDQSDERDNSGGGVLLE